VLSGTGSTREHIQRLGRVLRKGNNPNKLALLYEVVAENTSEENVSRRRHGKTTAQSARTEAHPQATQRQLELVPSPFYSVPKTAELRAAEVEGEWNDVDDNQQSEMETKSTTKKLKK